MPANIRTNVILLEIRIFLLYCRRWSFASVFVIFVASSENTMYFKTGCSRLSEVSDFGTNQKCVCDFLLVRHRNPGRLDISCLVSLMLQVFCSWPHPYSTPILEVFPLAQIADVGANQSRNHCLISRRIIFEILQLTRPGYLNVTDRRTDRHTNDLVYIR